MVIETPEEFTQRHGEYITLDSGVRLFADGASSQQDDGWGRLGSRREPPTDPIALLQLRRAFVSTKLNREVAAFNNFRNATLEQLDHARRFPAYCPPPSDRAEEQLKAGQARINDLQVELAGIDRELSQTPDAQAKREIEQRETEARQAYADRQQRVAAININQ